MQWKLRVSNSLVPGSQSRRGYTRLALVSVYCSASVQASGCEFSLAPWSIDLSTAVPTSCPPCPHFLPTLSPHLYTMSPHPATVYPHLSSLYSQSTYCVSTPITIPISTSIPIPTVCALNRIHTHQSLCAPLCITVPCHTFLHVPASSMPSVPRSLHTLIIGPHALHPPIPHTPWHPAPGIPIIPNTAVPLPAVCQVVPEVSRSRSNSTAPLTPSLAKW